MISEPIPNVLLVGPSGIGKTSVAKIIADRIAPEDCFHITAADVEKRGHDVIGNFASTCSFFGGGKVVIVEDADTLPKKSRTEAAKILPALRSRCATVDLTPNLGEGEELRKKCLKRIRQILNEEQIDLGDEVVETIIKAHSPDFRRIINEVQGRASARCKVSQKF